ncbi:MAG: ABC transporter ATP-binding protein [Planctomycetes bacterium]|nr:ABC transporter ATP-binding protein [Planctomycetota bacterium]
MAALGPTPVAAAVPPAGGPALSARDLVFAYGRARPVLNGLSLQAGRARLLGILGPNGSGKTTLLRILVGLLRPAAGEVRLASVRLADYPREALARRVAYVPQETHAALGFTVLETVLMGRSPHTGALGFEASGDWLAVREALRMTDTEALAERGLDELSGGERQRVILARALAQAPELVLLDEPTAFLDIKHQHTIYGLLRRLVRERGMTVVCVSHDLNLAAAYADELVLLDGGRAARAGRPEEVLRPEVLAPVYGVPVEVRTDEATGRPYVLPRPPA